MMACTSESSSPLVEMSSRRSEKVAGNEPSIGLAPFDLPSRLDSRWVLRFSPLSIIPPHLFRLSPSVLTQAPADLPVGLTISPLSFSSPLRPCPRFRHPLFSRIPNRLAWGSPPAASSARESIRYDSLRCMTSVHISSSPFKPKCLSIYTSTYICELTVLDSSSQKPCPLEQVGKLDSMGWARGRSVRVNSRRSFVSE